ncbi:MAG: hypothetical protein AB1664_10025, partial [Thermodesulfobacteriota bacterium]
RWASQPQQNWRPCPSGEFQEDVGPEASNVCIMPAARDRNNLVRQISEQTSLRYADFAEVVTAAAAEEKIGL